MKIIDLVGLLISNETMPKHIIFEEEEYCWDSSANDYICNDHDATQLFNNQYNMSNLPLFLGKRVEIIEEEKKIPEKLPYYSMEKIQKAKNKDEWREERITLLEKRVEDLHIKMNDLLDYLKSKGE